mmetsp:Transcript_8049/g.19309  ORF Transcript_8049/g.19309 Transcript_8049/m.19309 type:complete len:448 (+) Transcript_8049:46-1389(+)
MSVCQYGYVGPALLVLPLFLISLVNLFVAGPPLKTIIFDSTGADYGAKLPFLELQVGGTGAKFTLTPQDEITHFFVLTCYAPSFQAGHYIDAEVKGSKLHLTNKPLNSGTTRGRAQVHAASGQQVNTLQVLQPLLGFSEYTITVQGHTSSGVAAQLPAMEYRVTYVPSRFSYTQVCVRAIFTLTSLCMLVAYTCAMAKSNRTRELGQLWMTILLVLLIALNDPLYIVRIIVGGNQYLYCISMLGQIAFSGGLFLFWLVYADGMNNPHGEHAICTFYLPKALLAAAYVACASTLFLAYGRVPDRLNLAAVQEASDSTQHALIWGLSGSVVGVGVWLSVFVARAVYRLGWKKVEYIYTEREKSFVGITIVFVVLWLCGHLFLAFHGSRGSWMQLQLPFLTLTNSYLILLTHAFWPDDSEKVAPADTQAHELGHRDSEEHEGGLLDDDED